MGIVTTNKKIMLEFLKDCDRKDISEGRKQKYIFLFKQINRLKINLEKIDQPALDKLFFWLKQTSYTDWTKITKWKLFKRICKFVNKNIDFSSYMFKTPKLEPEILTLEEIHSLMSALRNYRDKLIVCLLYESGMRIGELLNLKKENVIFNHYGCILHVNGKTGSRPIRVIKCSGLIKAWIKTLTSEKLFNVSHRNINKIIKETAQRIGIKKRIYPHLFRHTRATHLAKHLTEPELKIFFGWAMNSNMPSTYVHLSMRDIDKKIIGLKA